MINKNRIVKTFFELVSIDSPSGEEEEISSVLAKKLKKLGGKIVIDSYGNLIAKFEGRGKPLMLNSHTDTVEPGRSIKPKTKGGKIVSDGTTIVGGDAKAGISIILEAIETARENKIAIRPLDVVLTREEETSLGGAKNLDYSLLRAKEGLVFDGDEEVYKIFVSSPTYYDLDVEITGRSAHAGVEPEKGISAIEIAAKMINGLKLGRLDEETTVNVGIIQGGSVRNAVPEKTRFHGEIRSRNKKTLERILKQTGSVFDSIAKNYPEAEIKVDFLKEFEGFKLLPSHPLIIKASNVLKGMELKAELKDSGGGSDANIFGENGLQVIIVGTGVYQPHTKREYVLIDQMLDSAKFCLEFIKA